MRVTYHPSVQKDVNGIPRYYDRVSLRLGDEFVLDLSAENPVADLIAPS